MNNINYIFEENERTNFIKDYFKNNPVPVAKGKILDIENDIPESYDVFEMPMYFFSHNFNNGRHFIETDGILNNNTIKNNIEIEKILYSQNEQKNKITKENLEKFSQQEPIISTKNGIIIDGNRRFMLLKKIWKEKELNLKEQTIKVLILKKDYNSDDLNRLETKVQFRKESKVDYDPINKKVKIFNMYQEMLENEGLKYKDEKIKSFASNENNIIKELSINTGESESNIKNSLKIISFIKWFLKEKQAEYLFKEFLNKDDQIKHLYTNIKLINKQNREKYWFDEDKKNIENMFIAASMYQILYKVKAVESFRPIMRNLIILKYKYIFKEWCEETIKKIGINIFNFDFKSKEAEEKREFLEKLNKDILYKIESKIREENELLNIKTESDKSEAQLQIENAISVFVRRLPYFDSVEKISEENINQLKLINQKITNFLINKN